MFLFWMGVILGLISFPLIAFFILVLLVDRS